MAFFPTISGPIPFEGRESKNPLAFKWYNKNQKVGDKTMAQHLRYSVAYWHSLKGTGSDMFGPASIHREWNVGNSPMEIAKKTMEAAFEFFQKLRIDYYCFHDRDIAPDGTTTETK